MERGSTSPSVRSKPLRLPDSATATSRILIFATLELHQSQTQKYRKNRRHGLDSDLDTNGSGSKFDPKLRLNPQKAHLKSRSADHKRRRSEESLCSGAEPESPLEPRIDPNWLLFEDLLEEWTSSESTASTPFDYMEASTAMTSPESVEDDEKDEMSTTPIPACSNSADP
ncbi:hypothetical protein DL98DRAFT_576599 [Cadophora sp. DSE1049]|nr:hypothetical protein DL98DRAFT_576599 [Cadophora sp. DSE1049]